VLYKYDEKYYISMIKNKINNIVNILTKDITNNSHSTTEIKCNIEDVYKIYGSIP
jgi:hypothetical protein